MKLSSYLIVGLLMMIEASALIGEEELYPGDLDLEIPPVRDDRSVRYDYDIVYVRAPRLGGKTGSLWSEIAHPSLMEPCADLMLLHPDGSEERLVEGGANGAVTDPVVSLDGRWVFYSHLRGLEGTSQHGRFPAGGADIYKIELSSRKIVRLTEQRYTPNLGAADWASDFRSEEKGKTRIEYGVLNMGPCPLPGGRIVFTSSRDGFIPPKHPSPTQQLFVMDDNGRNVEKIGHLNIAMALHPVVLSDGRIIFSTMESQGLRNSLLWGLWHIRPDGTDWGPIYSAFHTGGAPDAFHFQTQLSDGSIIAEQYYNQNNSGFGAYHKLPASPPEGALAFGPGWLGDPRNVALKFGRHYNGKPKLQRLPFTPFGAVAFTRFSPISDGEADPSVLNDNDSPRAGKFTHPSGAPDNHLLTVWSPGPVNHQNGLKLPAIDGGIYLVKSGTPVDEPAQMRLIKNDPRYNEQWPRAVVPYRRIYGIDEPATLEPLVNDGSRHKGLPEGTPFGLIGVSSFYKRESYPEGKVAEGDVTAWFGGERDPNGYEGLDPFNTSENGASLNWFNQGSEAGRYGNEEIHAVRILAMEPTTNRHRGNYPREGRLFSSHAMERLRILGEIPLRKPDQDGKEPLDPDGNPDTSFLAKIPADTAFTFQLVDEDGMNLTMAQTWHQLRPGEVRNNCGGCHAHSQRPTDFYQTAAGKADYKIWDLVNTTPMLTEKKGLREEKVEIENVEYHRDIRPILERSCIACHSKSKDEPAGNLVLDADDEEVGVPNSGKFPGTYYRLAMDEGAQFGYKPVIHNGQWRQTNASRYIRKFQSRRSLLVWKILGHRSDGWSNDDFPSARVPGDPESLELAGQPIPNTQQNRDRSDLDYNEKPMPPQKAIDEGKVKPLSDGDKRTLIRWIDLGCPIDLDYDSMDPDARGKGWMVDDNRPILTMTYPKAGGSANLSRILIGAHDYYTGLDRATFEVTADFQIDDIPAGENLVSRFREKSQGVWELRLKEPITRLATGNLFVSIRDREGNVTRLERTISVSGN
jgi:hypothetical protein